MPHLLRQMVKELGILLDVNFNNPKDLKDVVLFQVWPTDRHEFKNGAMKAA